MLFVGQTRGAPEKTRASTAGGGLLAIDGELAPLRPRTKCSWYRLRAMRAALLGTNTGDGRCGMRLIPSWKVALFAEFFKQV